MEKHLTGISQTNEAGAIQLGLEQQVVELVEEGSRYSAFQLDRWKRSGAGGSDREASELLRARANPSSRFVVSSISPRS